MNVFKIKFLRLFRKNNKITNNSLSYFNFFRVSKGKFDINLEEFSAFGIVMGQIPVINATVKINLLR